MKKPVICDTVIAGSVKATGSSIPLEDAEPNIIFLPERKIDGVYDLQTALYEAIAEFEGEVSVCEILGILRLLSDEISEEARNGD